MWGSSPSSSGLGRRLSMGDRPASFRGYDARSSSLRRRHSTSRHGYTTSGRSQRWGLQYGEHGSLRKSCRCAHSGRHRHPTRTLISYSGRRVVRTGSPQLSSRGCCSVWLTSGRTSSRSACSGQ